MNGLVELRCKQERQRLRRVVEDAHRVLKHFHTREQKDELSRSTAQKFAAEILRITRYASAIAAWTYLFVVNSKESALLVHPYEEEAGTHCTARLHPVLLASLRVRGCGTKAGVLQRF